MDGKFGRWGPVSGEFPNRMANLRRPTIVKNPKYGVLYKYLIVIITDSK